jgi:HK97 family phage major capsid protein
MPDNRQETLASTRALIAASRATRERVAARQRQVGAAGDSDAMLRLRAARAINALERGAEQDRRMASIRANRPNLSIGHAGAGRGSLEATERRRAFASWVRKGTPQAALQTLKDSGGGILAPMDFERELVRNLVQVSQVRQVARVGSTSTDTVRVPRRTGASTAAYVGEIEAASGTEPTYGAVDVPICDARAYVDLSNNLLDDAAIDIEAELLAELAVEFGRLEALKFIKGTGAKEPLGLMVSSDVGYFPGGDSNNNLTADAVIDLPFQLPAFYAQNGVWLMNRKTMAAVRKLKDKNDRYLFDENLNKDGLPMIQGRPVYDCPDMDDIGSNTYPILFGDVWRAYRIYDRLQVSISRDPYSLAVQNMTRFHARRRHGAAVVLGEAVKKLKIATS